MNKKVLLGLIFGLIIMMSILISASTSKSSINIHEGWNLILGFTPSSLEGENLDFSHIKAIYAYVPMENGYVRIYPNPENSKIDKYGDSYFEKQVMWVYSDVSQKTDYRFEEPLPIEERPLTRGWNFVGITSDMVGKSLIDVKGNCSIVNAYAWDYQSQQFGTILNIIDSKELFTFEEILKPGRGFIVKALSDCTLGSSGDIDSPPPIPN